MEGKAPGWLIECPTGEADIGAHLPLSIGGSAGGTCPTPHAQGPGSRARRQNLRRARQSAWDCVSAASPQGGPTNQRRGQIVRPASGGIDFGTSNSTVGFVEDGKPKLVASGGRRGHHAERRVLQLRGRSHLFRPPGHRRLHRQCRRTLAARPEERARHVADQREDADQGAFDRLFGHYRLVPALPQRRAGSGGRPAGRQHRARTAGAFRRRRSRGRSPGAERAGKGGRAARLQACRVPVRADRRGTRLRAERAQGRARADRRHRRRHIRLLHRPRFAGALEGGGPQGRHPGQRRHSYRRHRFRPAVQHRPADAANSAISRRRRTESATCRPAISSISRRGSASTCSTPARP